MTDRTETYEHYLNTCNTLKKEENKLIVAIFEKLKQTEPNIQPRFIYLINEYTFHSNKNILF